MLTTTSQKTRAGEWSGETSCQICHAENPAFIVDGQLVGGTWAVMCLRCHALHGVGLGLGRGQKYVRRGVKYFKAR